MKFCCSGHWGISDFVLISSTWTLALNFFLDLVAEMIYREIAAVFFQYLVMFKLNFKPGCCCAILGPAANQKRFKYTSQQCKVYHVFEAGVCENLKANLAQMRTFVKSFEYPKTHGKIIVLKQCYTGLEMIFRD